MTHVLVVDDREENLYLLEALLGGQGWSVTTARHGAEALAKARKQPPDLVVSDLLMPVMDGYTLLRHWKLDRQLERAPFVVYTATYTDSNDERLALDLGADAFILKPSEPTEFLARLQGVLAEGVLARTPRHAASSDEVIEGYSAALVRKLEEKSILLEEANRALQRDVEERRDAEEQLERTRAQLARLIESVDGIVYEADPATLRFTFVSPQAERLLGFPVRRWLDEHEFWARSLHPEDRDDVVRRCQEHNARRESHTLEYRAIAADGRTVWLRDQVRYEEDAGQPARLRGLMVDITEQRSAEAARRESEERLREMAENIGDVFYSYDLRTDRLLYVNSAFERLWGRPAEVVWSTPTAYLDDVHPQDRDAAAAALERQRAGETTDVELRVVRPDGDTRWVHEHAVPIRDGQGRVERIVGTMRDVSEAKRIEQQLLRTQRMESIGLLAGGIAHDLNNILSPILMCSDLLAPGETDPERQGMLGAIKESALRGAELIQQILSFARGVQGRHVSVNLAHLAGDVRRLIKDTFPKNIDVRVQGQRDLWTVHGDPTQLHQVLMNLAVNARDAMPDGGELTIAVDNHEVVGDAEAPHADARPGRYLRLRVSDTGVGIPPELQARVFELFFTTKPAGQGTGLGLSTVQTIVTSHGGLVGFTSEPGRGTTFDVLLPAESARASHPPQGEAPAPPPGGRGELVLVVDDEESLRAVTRMTLEQHGYRVLLAAHGAEALTLYAARREEVALVLTDMAMPIMDGAATIAALEDLDPAVRIVATSGQAESAGLTRALEAGRPFVAKPYTADALLRTVRQALDEPRP